MEVQAKEKKTRQVSPHREKSSQLTAHSELMTLANTEPNVLTEKFYSEWLRRQVLPLDFQSLNLGFVTHSVILGMLLSCVPQFVINKMELVISAPVAVLRIHRW